MMKKLLLFILLLVMPFSLTYAYPNEPSGYASLYWGEDISRVKKEYKTTFLSYDKTNSIYMVTIPNAAGELGMQGQVSIIATFENDQLCFIQIPLYRRNSSEVNSAYSYLLKMITSVCGKPTTYRNGIPVWSGAKTMMGIQKHPDTVVIQLIPTYYVRTFLKN